MAPRPLPQSRHPAMAPSNGTTSTPPKLVATLPPNHSTLQWHPTMAPSNGSTSTPPKLVVTLPPNHSTLQWHPTMAPSNSPKVGRRPPPLLEVRIPIAIAIWGKTDDPTSKKLSSANAAVLVGVLKYIGHPFPFSSNMENWLSN